MEKGQTGIHQLPGEKHKNPHHGCITCRARAENAFARRGIAKVTVLTEIAAVKSKYDNDKGREKTNGHDDPICGKIGEEFDGEDAVFELRPLVFFQKKKKKKAKRGHTLCGGRFKICFDAASNPKPVSVNAPATNNMNRISTGVIWKILVPLASL